MFVEELNGMESASVDVEMDIPAVEVWGAGFPNFNLWMHRLYGFPDGLADALALNTNLYIEECKFSHIAINRNCKCLKIKQLQREDRNRIDHF